MSIESGHRSNSPATARCQHCQAHVSPAFARVFGETDGSVHACPACAPGRAIRNGAAAQPLGGSQ
jgi:hypothetical protein